MTANAPNNSLANKTFKRTPETSNERGSALLGALLILAVLGAIAMTVLGVVHTETRIAGSDLERTRTFYAAASGIEKMASDFSALFSRSSRPNRNQLDGIQAAKPPELAFEGFQLDQTIELDVPTLTAMRLTQGIDINSYPTVTIPSGPYAGLTASVAPYNLVTTANSIRGAEVRLNRQINNYLVPIFQFGMFSNTDISLHPGPPFTFNGRVHANGNLYLNGDTTFLAKVTTANEAVVDVLRNGTARVGSVSFAIGAITVDMTEGSVSGGPNLPGALPNGRGDFPNSPNGNDNPNWTANSKTAAQAGVPNQFGGQILTRTTGISPLLLPLQLDGNPTREIIKRGMPNDGATLSASRYHNKAQIRILIDDENPADRSGIAAGRGVPLDQFDPIPLPAGAPAAGGGRALWQIDDNGNYLNDAASCVQQEDGNQADTVRSARSVTAYSPNGVTIPAGAGLSGRILIEIIAPDGITARDVTTEILSLGMTVGEPNGIVYLQRPLWAAFTQGSRDTSGGTSSLTQILNNTYLAADGEIEVGPGVPSYANDYLTGIQEETGAEPVRKNVPDPPGNNWNTIVPINIYNVREGRISSALAGNMVYERGVMSVVELNMRNLARWLDGVYDDNLLLGTNAISGNINGAEGYIVYVSDRRGDKVNVESDALGPITTSNGMVDNEDIYGPNGALDPGEDVIDAGTDVALALPKKDSLQKDPTELPDPAELLGTSGSDRMGRAVTVASWTNPQNYFRRSVRLFNGENLQVTGAADKLSPTKGITIASENMVYIWGNYNTTGINGQPTGASTLNDPTQVFFYLGNQISASIVADACFPLSKTWFDSASAMYPDSFTRRVADVDLPPFDISRQTSVRAGIIAGNNLAALAGNPDAGDAAESRLDGGLHNFPRFLESWPRRWNFVGSLIPLYHSTQALGPYNSSSSIYSPPIRNWAFDTTFRDPNRLPPGTPQFQYVQPTAFRQVL